MDEHCPACRRCSWTIDLSKPDHIRLIPCGRVHEMCAACSAARAARLEVFR